MLAVSVTQTGMASAYESATGREQGSAEQPVGGPSLEAPRERAQVLPETIAPSLAPQHIVATTYVGYDAAQRGAMGELVAEAVVVKPLALRAGGVYAPLHAAVQPSAGLKLAALSMAEQGVDLAIVGQYRPEGLTEPEGEVEAVLALGLQSLATGYFLNLVYGQDPEGRERDAELRLALLHAATRSFVLGADGRVRVGKPKNAREPVFDALIGPVASLALMPIVLSLQAGLSAYKLDVGAPRAGAFGQLGVSTNF